ncbi:MAG: hypothetical protein HFJ02_02780 [Bacilli bacterium]|jgi:hypothetical protein|nr:hypothetical protein [Bacilli bacterium]
MNVIINLPSEDNVESKALLQNSIDTFLISLMIETIKKSSSDDKLKKSTSQEVINLINTKAQE